MHFDFVENTSLVAFMKRRTSDKGGWHGTADMCEAACLEGQHNLPSTRRSQHFYSW
jgi:hypothetical protein